MGNTLYHWTTILKMTRFFLNIQSTTMKTKKLLFITLLCFSFVANAQRGVRIGYIDMEYILENLVMMWTEDYQLIVIERYSNILN